MVSLATGLGLRLNVLGLKVDRATAVLPNNTTGSIFTVSGGRVLLLGLLGECTVICNATATNLNVVFTPTTGTVNDLSGTLAIANKEVGTLFSITGLITDALVGADAHGAAGLTRQLFLPIGNMGLKTTAQNTGSLKWSLFYVPVDDGASVAAA